MRILFISNYFPGDLGPLARQLGAMPENEVLFASNRQRRDFALPGVRRVRLKNCPALFGEGPPSVPHIWEQALQRGDGGLRTLQSLRQSWGMPDIVFTSLAAGAAFFAPQAFPDAFFVTYAESGLKNYSLLPAPARNAWALLQSALFLQGQLCFAFSEAERRLFPPQVRADIRLVPPCVDTEIFSRAAAAPWFDGEEGAVARAPLLTLNSLGLEGKALGALLALGHAVLRELPGYRVILLTENASRKQALETAAAAWDGGCRERFAVYTSLPFLRYRDLLAASSLVVCPARGDAAERVMLECMSCEALLMAPAGAASFLRPGVNMLELPVHAPAQTAEAAGGPALSQASLEAVLAALRAWRKGAGATGREGVAPQARMARRNVLAHFSEATVVPRHLGEVLQAWTSWKKEREGLRAQ